MSGRKASGASSSPLRAVRHRQLRHHRRHAQVALHGARVHLVHQRDAVRRPRRRHVVQDRAASGRHDGNVRRVLGNVPLVTDFETAFSGQRRAPLGQLTVVRASLVRRQRHASP